MRLSPLLIATALAPLALATLTGCGSDDDGSSSGKPHISLGGDATDSTDATDSPLGGGSDVPTPDGDDSRGPTGDDGPCPVTLDQVKDATGDDSQSLVLRINDAGAVTGSCTYTGSEGGVAVSWVYSYADNLGSDLRIACTDDATDVSVSGADEAFTCSGSISPIGIAVFGDDFVQVQPSLDEGNDDALAALMGDLTSPPPAGS